MRVYSWKYSLLMILLVIVGVVGLILANSTTGGSFLGTSAAIAIDFKFILIVLVGTIFSRRFNPLLLGALAGIVYQITLHAIMQDRWRQLGISPEFWATIPHAIFAGVVIYSAIHLALEIFTYSSKKE